MSLDPDIKRCDLFGWDYELVNPLTEEEVAWYWTRATILMVS